MREHKKVNLLEDTLDVLGKNGKTALDVEFIRFNTEDGARHCEWEEFEAKASTTEYIKDYSGPHINSALMIVGRDWWMERAEYDGLEWWKFCERPRKPVVYAAPNLKEDW